MMDVPSQYKYVLDVLLALPKARQLLTCGSYIQTIQAEDGTASSRACACALGQVLIASYGSTEEALAAVEDHWSSRIYLNNEVGLSFSVQDRVIAQNDQYGSRRNSLRACKLRYRLMVQWLREEAGVGPT